jgi:hypothetical protein
VGQEGARRGASRTPPALRDQTRHRRYSHKQMRRQQGHEGKDTGCAPAATAHTSTRQDNSTHPRATLERFRQAQVRPARAGRGQRGKEALRERCGHKKQAGPRCTFAFARCLVLDDRHLVHLTIGRQERLQRRLIGASADTRRIAGPHSSACTLHLLHLLHNVPSMAGKGIAAHAQGSRTAYLPI